MIVSPPAPPPVPSARAAHVVSVKAHRVRAHRGVQLRISSRGPTVWRLQRGLARLHYAVPLSGYFDEATGRAVVAYRKVLGMARVEVAGARILHLLHRGAGRYHVRFR